MHLIKDENGNLVPHGAHDHGHEHHHEDHHDHAEGHCHEHCGSCGSSGDKCKDEAVALLAYMKQHNEQHAAELDTMAANIEKMGMTEAAKQIREAVSDFQKGNLRLSLALTLVQEALKEA